MSDTALTTSEQSDKAALMTRVRDGLQTWVDVGTALMELRDRKLWRDEAPDFTSFCQVHFGFSKRRANQLIEATSAVMELETGGPESGKHASQNGLGATKNADRPAGQKPTSSRQAEELAKAPKGKRRETWERAVETAPKDDAGKPKVTAAHVRRVVRQEEPPAPSSNGKHEPDPVEPFELPPAEPWEQVAESTLRIIGELETVADDMRRSYGATSNGSEKKLTHPGAARYSWRGTVGAVNDLIDYLNKDMPVGSDARGIVTATDKAKAKAFAGSRGAQ